MPTRCIGAPRSGLRRHHLLCRVCQTFAEGFNLGREAHFNNAKIVFPARAANLTRIIRAGAVSVLRNLLGIADERLSQLRRFNRPVVTFANSPESYMQYVDQHPDRASKWALRFNSKE